MNNGFPYNFAKRGFPWHWQPPQYTPSRFSPRTLGEGVNPGCEHRTGQRGEIEESFGLRLTFRMSKAVPVTRMHKLAVMVMAVMALDRF
eukprot:662444-Rhodomonas_salina.2